ncbi:pyridoxamine 5'-phosphate oxidase family protein [Paenibacillus prosopidis]|uniref:Nitroimidazol reductase NimA-like FMN-containing flavoprotein (Pyridoxamine 5'-phosphate oxidase superfamily) n=1 Tax=Paenibacillus prosopidis TaxID=630520 RepID=A0A368W1H2_9BACL|nr:pyridoxamine 5'-phosphate oxidase family protein [Paenibacillus prosopidis]RCW46498.1 hypothetical protein DFP97_109143 [Paenibacillus prosopidis]
MFSIRYQKRECTDSSKIDAFLSHANVGFLGLSDGSQPYVVPLNFIWLDGAFYFHGAAAGRKVNILEKNKEACFTVSEQYGTITNPIPAHTDTAYMSVMAFGHIELLDDLDQALYAMQRMLDKYVPGYYDKPLSKAHLEKYRSSLGSATLVFKLICSSMTAKENEEVPERMYDRAHYSNNHVGD